MHDRVEQILKGIDDIIIDLLVPLRTSKTINRKAFNKLYSYLDEIKEIVKEHEMINRKLTGLLFFIYTSVEDEGRHANYPNPIFMELVKLQDYLANILGDSKDLI